MEKRKEKSEIKADDLSWVYDNILDILWIANRIIEELDKVDMEDIDDEKDTAWYVSLFIIWFGTWMLCYKLFLYQRL